MEASNWFAGLRCAQDTVMAPWEAQEVAVWLAGEFCLPKVTIHAPLKILRSQTVFYLSDWLVGFS